MKTFNQIILLIFLFSGINSTFGQDLKKENLKGKVKSERYTQYKVVKNGRKVERGNRLGLDKLTLFDINGEETERTIYNLDGSVDSKHISKRDSLGKILEEIHYSSPTKIPTSTSESSEDGKLLSRTINYNDGTSSTTIFTYDNKGNCNLSVLYDYDKSFKQTIKTKITYNNGKKVESIDYDTNGKVESILKYDYYGYVMESLFYNPDGTPSQRKISFTKNYKYNENGIVIGINTYYPDGKIIPFKLTYDDKGNHVESIEYNKEGKMVSKETYNNKGYRIENISYNSEGNIEDKYKYDEKGNLIDMLFYNPDGTLLGSGKFNRDEKGNTIEYVNKVENGDKRITYKNDLDGNEIENITYLPDSKPFKTTSEYTFDTHGNWVKWIQSCKGNPTVWIERTLEYYD